MYLLVYDPVFNMQLFILFLKIHLPSIYTNCEVFFFFFTLVNWKQQSNYL